MTTVTYRTEAPYTEPYWTVSLSKNDCASSKGQKFSAEKAIGIWNLGMAPGRLVDAIFLLWT